MAIPSKILELWQEYSSAAFPKGHGGKQLNGTDLPLLEAEIAGCIHMYVHRGELDFRRVEILSRCLIDLNAVILLMDSEEFMYFDRLRRLATLVLQEVKR
jgi:hypothetical protein